MNNKEPIFKAIFGNDWEQLPIVMKRHYANLPFSQDIVTVRGKMDIKFNWFGKLCAPIFKLFNTLIPHQGTNIDTIVHYRSNPNDTSFSFDRVLDFPNKAPFHFRSKMVQIKNQEVIEFMNFGLGWHMDYVYENDLVKLKHRGYVIKILGITIPIPLSLIIGKGYAEERALSDNSFEMLMTITHPLWGLVYKYKGKFEI